MRSITSIPRVEPIRHGVHFPQLSMAQNSMAKRACLARSAVSSNTTMPPCPPIPSTRRKSRSRAEYRAAIQGNKRPNVRPPAPRAAAVLDISRQLNRERAARPAQAEIAIKLRTLIEDDRHRRQRDHIVDNRRLAEQSFNRRQGRFVANLAPLAFEAFEQRGFFTADIGARAEPDIQIEALAAAATLAPR
jgi:hypothetical protein